jgi:hypothetical protein
MRETILLLSPVPADLRAGLAACFDLVEDWPGGAARPGFRIAVTTAMAGAERRSSRACPTSGCSPVRARGWNALTFLPRRGAASQWPTRRR